jgi:hypothetical protein
VLDLMLSRGLQADERDAIAIIQLLRSIAREFFKR